MIGNSRLDRLIQQPYMIFWSVLIIFVGLGILGGTEWLTVSIHDWHYQIPNYGVALVSIIIFGAIGLWYYMCERLNLKLSKWLSAIHAFGSSISWVLIWYCLKIGSDQDMPARYYQDDLIDLGDVIIAFLFVLLVSQLAFILNGLLIIVRRIRIK